MRRAPLIALLLLAAGCSFAGSTASGTRTGVGVLVQGTTGRCATVLVGVTPRRVCAPHGNGSGETGTATPDTAAAPSDSARVTH